jgi:hypothetical protein
MNMRDCISVSLNTFLFHHIEYCDISVCYNLHIYELNIDNWLIVM